MIVVRDDIAQEYSQYHNSKCTETVNYYFHPHEELGPQFDGCRYNALDIVEGSDVNSISVDKPTGKLSCRLPEMPLLEVRGPSAKRSSSSPERAYMHTVISPTPTASLPQ